SRRRHTRFDCDWSSDVCSSDLWVEAHGRPAISRETLRAEANAHDALSVCSAQGFRRRKRMTKPVLLFSIALLLFGSSAATVYSRSEERRVGKERRSR